MAKSKKTKYVCTALLSILAIGTLSAAVIFFFAQRAGSSTPSSSDQPSVTKVTPSHDVIENESYLLNRNTHFGDSFRSELLSEEKILYDAMVQHIVVERRSDDLHIDFSSVTKGFRNNHLVEQMVFYAFEALQNDYQESFRVTYPISIIRREGDMVREITLKFREQYPDRQEEVDTVFANIDLTVEKIRETRASGSRYHTAKAIHDYICRKMSYDYEAVDQLGVPEANTILPLFGGGNRGCQFICEGYARSFQLLCSRFDVPCVLVAGNVNVGNIDAENVDISAHAWNEVKMDDGKWYGVDVTWDDTGGYKPIYTHFLCGKNTVDEYSAANATFSNEHHPDAGIFMSNEATFFYPELADERYQPADS